MVILGVTGLLLGAMLGVVWQIGPQLDQRFVPGVWIWNTAVGGMTQTEAETAVSQGFALQEPRIILVGPGNQRWQASPADFGMELDHGGTLRHAYAVGHTGQGVTPWLERLTVMVRGEVVAPVFSWNQERARQRLTALAAELDQPARDAGIRMESGSLVLVEGVSGQQMDVTATLALLTPILRNPPGGAVEIPLVMHSLPPRITDDEATRAMGVARTILEKPLTLLISHPLQNDPGPWVLTQDVLAQMLVIRVDEKSVWVGLDEQALTRFLDPLALGLRREAVDARFHFDPAAGAWAPVKASAVGRELDMAASVAQINQMVQTGEHFVPLVLKEIQPRYSDSVVAADLGIKELVATGESYFTGSSSSRDKNIRVGTTQFDGVIIAPGQTFSFNEYLGDVTPERGYDESYVIIGNRTVPGVGGGICQVATTVFRAAFFAGFPIVERWAHAYRVGYYELGGFGPGFDATIYSPLVDFRFTNDTPYHLLIQTEVDTAHNRLRFYFYSTSMGRTVEQIGPEWGDPEPAGAPIYEFDSTLPAGSVRQLETAHSGLSAVLKRVVKDAAGNILYQDRFVSHFVPWAARFRYGPDYIPPADAVIVTPQP